MRKEFSIIAKSKEIDPITHLAKSDKRYTKIGKTSIRGIARIMEDLNINKVQICTSFNRKNTSETSMSYTFTVNENGLSYYDTLLNGLSRKAYDKIGLTDRCRNGG